MVQLSLSAAERIAKAALTYARANDKSAVGVVVIDASTNVKVALREDGANLAAVDLALGKARAALTFGCPSKVIAEALSGNALAGPSVLSVLDGRIVLLGGGVLVQNADGVTVGAIGAAGGPPDDDEAIAMAGAAAL